MAHKPTSFKLDEKKKVIVIYTNIEAPAEKLLIDFYLTKGYAPMFDEKKSFTVKDMRKAMKDDKKALEEFNAIYAKKVDNNASEEEKRNSGFFGACKYYNDWKKAVKQVKTETEEKTEE